MRRLLIICLECIPGKLVFSLFLADGYAKLARREISTHHTSRLTEAI